MIRRLIVDGKFTWVSESILGGLVLLGLFGIPFFDMPMWLAIPIGLITMLSAFLLMFEGRAVALGLKPFTNDPLGWRKAKESYKSPEDAEKSAKKDAQP
jgi:hypothetical protein